MSKRTKDSKTILITGATSGIGYALFEQYTQAGHNVIACGRNHQQINNMRNRAFKTCLFDMTNKHDVEHAADAIPDIDILILNAGNCDYINHAKNFEGELFANIISTNLTSMGWLLQYFLPKVKQNGQVVFISSSATIVPFPRSEAYGASKAGIDYLANSLRLDLVKENIDVTLVHPGFIKTPLTNKNDFSMPFLLSATDAAQRIITGVNKRKTYLHFPKRLTFLLKLFSFLPKALWQSIILRKQTS